MNRLQKHKFILTKYNNLIQKAMSYKNYDLCSKLVFRKEKEIKINLERK
jgi:hypothetical protein